MIFKVWMKISLIVLLVSVPLIWIQYHSQRESIELAMDMAERIAPVEILDSHMNLLKRLAKYEPKEINHFKEEFSRTVDLKFAKQDMVLIREKLITNLSRDTLRNTAIVFGLFLILSLFVSSNLVWSFKRILKQLQMQAQRLEKLSSIESWQKIARILVHELRAPITPIKLVSTDIEDKYATLSPAKFGFYLSEGAGLIRSQVQAIEDLLGSFIQFAKLPSVECSEHSITTTLENFKSLYSGYNSQITIELELSQITQPVLKIDPRALNHLLFNLIKNAAEANIGRSILVSISARQGNHRTWIQIKNEGRSISKEIVDRIFDLHVSTKRGNDTMNLGIGLTVAHKIALDHQGDLYLISNQDDAVTFELELPSP